MPAHSTAPASSPLPTCTRLGLSGSLQLAARLRQLRVRANISIGHTRALVAAGAHRAAASFS